LGLDLKNKQTKNNKNENFPCNYNRGSKGQASVIYVQSGINVGTRDLVAAYHDDTQRLIKKTT